MNGQTIATISGTSTAAVIRKKQRRAGGARRCNPHEGVAELGGMKLGHMM
jgi:hypothetical protein